MWYATVDTGVADKIVLVYLLNLKSPSADKFRTEVSDSLKSFAKHAGQGL